MSLDYDLKRIKNVEELCYYQDGTYDDGEPLCRLQPLTEALIFIQMATFTGGSITADNVDEVYARISIVEQIDGAYRRDAQGEPVFITWRDVYNHIGLHTNAYTNNKTRFKNEMMKAMFRRAYRRADKEREDMENADGLVKLEDAVAGRS